jgi:ribosomal protein S4
LFRYHNNQLKNFLRFTKFYKIIKRNFKNRIIKKLIKKSLNFISLKPVYQLGIYGKSQTNVKQFIFQRRKQKEGFTFWQKYATKWLHYSIFKNRLNKFYFTPLRTKRWIITKKQKYLQIYKKLSNIHPRPGKWSTIGLVGNTFARNTLFVKKKILLKIFSNFYKFNLKNFRNIIKKYNNNTFSKFNNELTKILNFFECRLDVLTFRSGFTVSIDLANILVTRGYIQVNFIQNFNPHLRMRLGNFISLINKYRKLIFELSSENYESFRNLYLNRFYKTPYLNILSSYINALLSNVTQMQGKHFWNKSLGNVQSILTEYETWNPHISTKNLYQMQLNFESNPLNRFDKEIGLNLIKPNNWQWFRKENIFLKNRNNFLTFNLNIFKTLTIKQIYSKNLIDITTTQLQPQNKKINSQFFNFQIFKLIIKDLLIQTWEKFPKNLLINSKFRFACLFQYFKMNFNFYSENLNLNGRINFYHFRWLTKNV